jgi:hypothetical protein
MRFACGGCKPCAKAQQRPPPASPSHTKEEVLPDSPKRKGDHQPPPLLGEALCGHELSCCAHARGMRDAAAMQRIHHPHPHAVAPPCRRVWQRGAHGQPRAWRGRSGGQLGAGAAWGYEGQLVPTLRPSCSLQGPPPSPSRGLPKAKALTYDPQPGPRGRHHQDAFRQKPVQARHQRLLDVAGVAQSLFKSGHAVRGPPACTGSASATQ